MDPQPELAARYDAALQRLVGRINYERSHTLPCKFRGLTLDRMRQLLARLGSPEQALKIVHVAGTKGKGSTCALLAAALGAAGRRTGLFTSPHLDCVEQRLVVDGQPCSPGELADLVEHVWPAVTALDELALRQRHWATGPTYFEITTAMALVQFARRGVEAAVLEVGMGGRLDSTNVCQPLVSVITSISFDHTRQLGTTLAAIAGEKAGIIKPGVPLVSGVQQDEPRQVIAERARRSGSLLVQLGRDFDFRYHPARAAERQACCGTLDFWCDVPGAECRYADVALNLLGAHQAANAAVALAVMAQLRRAGWNVPEDAVRHALATTSVPARVEVVAREPAVIIDAAHNVASAAALVEVLRQSISRSPRTLIFGTTEDKDVRGMLAVLLPHFDQVVLTRYRNNPRGVPVEKLAAVAGELWRGVIRVADDSAAAWELVRHETQQNALVCVAGSFFLAAEMRPLIARLPAVASRDAALQAV